MVSVSPYLRASDRISTKVGSAKAPRICSARCWRRRSRKRPCRAPTKRSPWKLAAARYAPMS